MAQVLDVTGLLGNAQSPDASVRNAAEIQLKQFEESQYASFVLSLAAELGASDKPVDSRRLAGLLLKNALDAKDSDRQALLSQRWTMLDPAVRTQVKQRLLSALQAEVVDARHTAALVVAKVGAIEIPLSGWPELIPALLAGAGAGVEPAGVRQTALEALGYVCEELGALEDDFLAQDTVNAILTCVVGGMSGDEADLGVRLAATVALDDALLFARKNFESEAERSYIMRRVCEGTLAADPRLRLAAWECLVSVAGDYYETLPAYMADLFSLTQRAVRGDEESVALQALEFWCTICEAEAAAQDDESGQEVCHGFVRGALPELVPLLLELLMRQEEDGDGGAGDDGAWNLAMAAGTTLGLAAGVVGGAIVPLVLPFIQANFQKTGAAEDWRAREAATFAFGSILEGPSPAELRATVAAAMPFLLAALADPHPQVKNTTAWTIGRVLEFVHAGAEAGEPLVGPGDLPGLVLALLGAVADAPHVAEKACYALSQLAAGFAGKEDPATGASPMSPYFQPIVEALLKTAMRLTETVAESARLHMQAFEAMNEVVRASAPDVLPLVSQLVPLMVGRLNDATAASASSVASAEARAEEQGLLCGVLQVLTQRLAEEEAGRAALAPQADAVAAALLGVLASRGDSVHEEAMLAMGALTYATGRGFAKYLPAFFPVLERGLRRAAEWQACQASIGVLGDVCRAVEDGIAPYADAVVSAVLGVLSDANAPRALKPLLLSALGDLALALGAGFEQYLAHVGPVLQGSMSLAAQLGAGAAQRVATGADPDEDLDEYGAALRMGIVEAWAGMLNGLPRAAADAQLRGATPALLDLVQAVADGPRDGALCKAALALLGDVAGTLSGAGAELTKRPRLSEWVAAATEDPALAETANWTSQVVGRALRAA